MKQIIIIFIFAIFFSSCACLEKSVDNSGIFLTKSNLTLLNGKYQRKSVQIGKDSLSVGDLYWNLFANSYSFALATDVEVLNLKSDVDFIELKVINKNKILVSYINENDTLASKIMKGKIKNGYFEFRRKYLIIPLIFSNVYKNSKFRIGLSNDNNLMGDYKNITLGTIIVLYPIYDNVSENDIKYNRIVN